MPKAWPWGVLGALALALGFAAAQAEPASTAPVWPLATRLPAPDGLPAPAPSLHAEKGFSLFGGEKEERHCGELTVKHQLALEAAALGGDHDAQMQLAACSWPLDRDGNPILPAGFKPDVSGFPVLLDAFVWVQLARCWVPLTDDDGPSAPISYLSEKERSKVTRRWVTLDAILSTQQDGQRSLRESANEKLMQYMARSGAPGLVELDAMSDCALGRSDGALKLAIWQVAAMRYRDDQLQHSTSGDESKRKRDDDADRLAKIDPDWIYNQVKKYEPRVSGDQLLESNRLQEILIFPFLGGIGGSGSAYDSPSSLANMGSMPVEALQLALLADLPQGRFRGSISGVYDQYTVDAAKEAQSRGGPLFAEGTTREGDHVQTVADGWIKPAEARALICGAATEHRDYFSLYYLGFMYYMGYGFAKNAAIAEDIFTDARRGLQRDLDRPEPWHNYAAAARRLLDIDDKGNPLPDGKANFIGKYLPKAAAEARRLRMNAALPNNYADDLRCPAYVKRALSNEIGAQLGNSGGGNYGAR